MNSRRSDRISFREEIRGGRRRKSPMRQLMLWVFLLALVFFLLYILK